MMTHSEFGELASHYHSLPVHPTQLYSTVNAMLICLVLMAIFNRRRRHGVVIGWMIIMYSVSRFFIEGLRADQPHDVAGLTVSQGVALAMLATGVTILVVVYKFLPMQSPRAVAWIPPEEEEGTPATA
jgi:prolipoprotein diacylglyceryltransferase